MNKLAHTVLACTTGLALALAVVQLTPAMAQGGGYQKKHKGGASQHSHGHNNSNKGGKIAAGVAAAIIGGIIVNEVAKSQSRGYSGGRLSCRQLVNRCEDGQDWACRKLDRDC